MTYTLRCWAADGKEFTITGEQAGDTSDMALHLGAVRAVNSLNEVSRVFEGEWIYLGQAPKTKKKR